MPSTSKSASLIPTAGSESSSSRFWNIGIQSVRGVRTLCRCTLPLLQVAAVLARPWNDEFGGQTYCSGAIAG